MTARKKVMSKKLLGWLGGIEVAIFTVLQGSAVTLGLLVAPVLFVTIRQSGATANPDDLAGKVFGNILHIWLWATLVCALILLATAIYTYAKIQPRRRLLLGRVLTMGLITALTLGFAYTLFRIDTIQAGLTKPIDAYPAGVGARGEFDFLHNLSTDLISASLLVGTVWLVLSVLAVVSFYRQEVYHADTTNTVSLKEEAQAKA